MASLALASPAMQIYLVNELVVKEPMDPVDTHVSEEQKGNHAEDHSQPACQIRGDTHDN